jgi:hypothetical protein
VVAAVVVDELAAGVLVLLEDFLLLPHAAKPSTAIAKLGINSFERIGLPPLDFGSSRPAHLATAFLPPGALSVVAEGLGSS